MPASADPTGTPTASSRATARTALATLKRPGRRTRAGHVRPPCPCRANVEAPPAADGPAGAGGHVGRGAVGGACDRGGGGVGPQPGEPASGVVVDRDDLARGPAVEQ